MKGKGFKWILTIVMLAGCSTARADPWADQVVNYVIGNPAQFKNNASYNQPDRALGRPYGLIETVPDNTSLVSLEISCGPPGRKHRDGRIHYPEVQ